MGSSFEELVVINPTVKADLNSDARIKSYGFLNFSKPQINAHALLDEVASGCGVVLELLRSMRVWSGGLITHKYRGSQQFSRVEYSTQIYRFHTRGAKEYLKVLAAELSIQPHLDNLVSAAKYLVAR